MKQRLAAFWRRRAALPIACYALAAAAWLLLGVWGKLGDIGLEPWSSVPVEAFACVDLVPDPAVENGYTATSLDPQLILEGLSGRKLRTLSYVPLFPVGEPREICLYYTNRAGEPFSQNKRIFPKVQANGRYVFTLPQGNIAALRLDPCSPADGTQVTVVFTLGTVDLNYQSTLPHGLAYFLPNWYQLFCLLLCPALAAAALDWLRAVWRLWRARPHR